jgi:3-dehydroquinate synthase
MAQNLILKLTTPLQESTFDFSEQPFYEALNNWLSFLRSFNKVVCIVDVNVLKAQDAVLKFSLHAHYSDVIWYSLPSGESAKSLTTVYELYDFLIENNVSRNSLLIAIGGGVTSDLAGFVAATYLRGIAYAIIPTTLLSMVDSCLGGKNGVNLSLAKNAVGTIYQPSKVLICPYLLKTLPERSIRSGLAEIIKYALLGEKSIWEWLESNSFLDFQVLPSIPIIYNCLQLKAQIVQADPYEINSSGGRRLLNLGHTFAHAIEQVDDYKTYEHGEAVAIGLYLAASLSRLCGYLNAADLTSIQAILSKCSLPYKLVVPLKIQSLIAAMKRDKKQKDAATFTCVLLRNIGDAFIMEGISEKTVSNLWLSVGATE